MIPIESIEGEEEDWSIHLSFSNRFERDIEMKKQGARRKTLGLGWNFSLFSRESCKKRGRGKRTPPYIDNGNGSHNLKVQSS